MKFFTCLLLFVSLCLQAQEKETISWDNATISNKLTLTISKRDFNKIYKKADSIVTPDYTDACNTDDDNNFKYLYYKGTKFEMDNGILNFRKITFSKKAPMFFMHKGIRYDGTMTVTAFSKLFPVAIADLDENKFKALQTETDPDPVIIAAYEENTEYEWLFSFSNGKLISIECYFSCF